VLNLTIPLKPLQKLGQNFLNIILAMLSAKRRVCVTPLSIGIYKKGPFTRALHHGMQQVTSDSRKTK
jgi:hypothetical protein